jgi:hypothetical protein
MRSCNHALPAGSTNPLSSISAAHLLLEGDPIQAQTSDSNLSNVSQAGQLWWNPQMMVDIQNT